MNNDHGNRPLVERSLEDARPTILWTDRPDRPTPSDPLVGARRSDLAIVGAGFTGLWAAVLAAEAEPGRSVTVVEAETVGFGASARNGGFVSASLTHGLANGLRHWPDEIEQLERLGRQNLAELCETIERHEISCGLERSGDLDVATAEWQVPELAAAAARREAHGHRVQLLDQSQVRSRIASPTYLAGLFNPDTVVMVDPARLCWGLLRVAESLGVTIYERSPVQHIKAAGRDPGSPLIVATPNGSVTADRVVVATNAYRGPVRTPTRFVIPVYDHVLATEPLSDQQMVSIGWEGREGVSDVANQFHYYRLTVDNRILWGGYDASYHFGGRVDPRLDQSDDTHELLADHFFTTFPQLEGVRFTHRWGGPIGTSTKFSATWGLSKRGRMVTVGGYTGLGVGASRFGAQTALDLVDRISTERTELQMVRQRPLPFPPEPVRWAGVALTRRAIQRADDNEGRRGLWLRFLDRLGVGFDS